MFCGKCGAQIPEGAKFCGVCGAAVEAAVAQAPAAETPAAPVAQPPVMEAPVMEAPVMEAPVMEAPPAQVAVDDPDLGVSSPEEGKKKGGGKKIAVLAVCAVAAVAVVAGVVLLLSNLRGGRGNPQAFVYQDQKGRLQYMANAKEGTEPQSLGSIDALRVRFSRDGKSLFILDRENTFYATTSAAIKSGDKPQRVSKDIDDVSHHIYSKYTDDGRVLYTKRKNDVPILYCYDGKDSFELARDILTDYGSHSYRLSKDQKSVYYFQRNSDGSRDLCKARLKDGAEAEVLVEDASVILSAYDADELLFARSATGTPIDKNTLEVYSCAPGGKSELLVEGVCGVLTPVAEDASEFYFTRNNRVEHNLYDYVTDGLADADAKLLAEELHEPSWYGEFYPETVWMQDGVWYYTDQAGNNHEVDVTDYMYLTAPGDYLQEFFAEEAAYDTAQALYQAADDEYDQAWQLRREAQDRENMREKLKGETSVQVTYDIYHYTGGTSTAVATDATDITASGIMGVIFYKKADTSNVGKVVDIDVLSDWQDIYSYLESDDNGADWYQLVGDIESELELDSGDTIQDRYSTSDTELVLRLSTDGGERLERWAVSADRVDYAETLISENVKRCQQWLDDDGKLAAWYVLAGNDNTLYCYRDGKVTELAGNVFFAKVLPDSGVVFALVNRNSDGESELVRVDSKGQVEEIDNTARGFAIIDDSTVLYTVKDNLYCWDGKDSHRVAKNVSSVPWTAGDQAQDVLYLLNY